jgi:AcrR family transcriptional regulator
MDIQLRKRRERQRRQRQIMRAAKRVFAAKGFSRSTMEDIARAAELSPGTLYLYFRNKDELYASLSLEVIEHLLHQLTKVRYGPHTSTPRRIDMMKKALYAAYRFDPLIFMHMFHVQSHENLKNVSPDMLAQIRKLSRDCLECIAHIFEGQDESRRVINRPPIALSNVLWAMFSGVVLWEESKRVLNKRSSDLHPTLDMAFEIFSRGISR